MEAPIAEAAAGGRQLAQASPDDGIIGSGAPIANRTSIGAEHPTRPPFAHLKCHSEMSDGLTPCDGRHHFLN